MNLYCFVTDQSLQSMKCFKCWPGRRETERIDDWWIGDWWIDGLTSWTDGGMEMERERGKIRVPTVP